MDAWDGANWLIVLAAAGFGGGLGVLLVRPVYRLSVAPGEPWRPCCGQGHRWTAGPRGWLGPGRCARCRRGVAEAAGERPPARWPLLVASVVCAVVLAGALGDRAELVVWLLLVPGMVAVTAVDIAVLRLPDPLTYSMAAVAAVALGVLKLLPVTLAGGSWTRALLGGVVLSGALLLLALLNPRGMGLGDVKLALSLGVVLGWYGWDVLLAGVFLGFLLGALWAVFLIVARGAGRGTAFSMGPFLALGTLGGVVLAGLAG